MEHKRHCGDTPDGYHCQFLTGEKQTSPTVGGERGISLFLTLGAVMGVGALNTPNLLIWHYSGRVEQVDLGSLVRGKVL